MLLDSSWRRFVFVLPRRVFPPRWDRLGNRKHGLLWLLQHAVLPWLPLRNKVGIGENVRVQWWLGFFGPLDYCTTQ